MSRRIVWIYGALALVMVALYMLAHLQDVGTLIALSAVVAVWIGIRRNRPRRRLPWFLLSGGMLAFAIGTSVTYFLTEVLHQTGFPSIADAIFLGVSTPMLLTGLVSLTRSGAVIRDRASMLDALILTVGLGFLSWTFLVSPYLHNPDLTAVEKGISVAYPLGDVLILALLARLAIGARSSPSLILLVVSGTGLLTADMLYGLSQLNGGWHLGGPADLGWAVFYTAGGAAALDRSMTRLTEPRIVVRTTELQARRLMLGAISLIAPTTLLLEALRGNVRDGVVIAIASATLAMLAITRLSLVANGLRRTTARERELRQACEALLSTTGTDQISRAVHAAIAALLPPGTAHRTVLHVQPDATVDRARSDATLDPSRDEPGRAVSIRPAAALATELSTGLAAELDGFPLVLHCPLFVGGRRIGDLYVAGDELPLIGLQEAASVLAGQAASMIDHIALNREINRRDSEAYFRTLVLNATDVIVILDDDNRIRYASPSATQLFHDDLAPGAEVLALVVAGQRAAARAMLAAVGQGSRQPDSTWTMHRTDGMDLDVEVAIRDLRHEPTVNGVVLTLRDVSERQRLQLELLRRAHRDGLTGLGNRYKFNDTVQGIFDSGVPTGTIAAVLLADLDDFRVVNDTMGHDLGDALLVATGQRLTAVLGSRGTVARLGADEFGIVLPDAPDIAHVELVVEQILAAFADPFQLKGSIVTARPSVGVATTLDATDSQQLLSQADVALSSAKGAGRGRWRRYEASLHSNVLRHMQLGTELGHALADNALEVYYQPIVDLTTGETRGLEALARWPHPTRGMVGPDEFIPIAEENGAIVPLGAWVLRTAITAAAGWQRKLSPYHPSISVNVSVRQFRTPGFVDQVRRYLRESGLAAQLLTLEITETLLLADQEQIQGDLAALRDDGVKISIDDFGTGYSSLSYLHRVPVDSLKLDKSFVDTISTSTRQQQLVVGIIQLARTLSLEVVAEGIETAADQNRLIHAGCVLGQGYLFARPMPQNRVESWLVERGQGNALRSA